MERSPTLSGVKEDMAVSSVVLIVAANEVEVLKTESGFDKDVRVFADADAIKALQLITRDRPRLVVLGRAFTETDRGAGLVNTVTTHPDLAHCQIRVLGQASDYLRLVSRRAEAGLAPGTAVPGEPLPPDYLGSRQARRFGLDSVVEVQLNGQRTTLVDLSRTGARVVGPSPLHPYQRVRVSLVDSTQTLTIAASVMWVFFEPVQGEDAPRYRAGVKFIDGEPEATEAFSLRHRQD